MKRNLLAAIVLISLCGLTLVQFRLLVIGARLEKQRFDRELLVVQRNIRQALDQSNPVSDALIGHLKNPVSASFPAAGTADSLHAFLKQELIKQGIGAQFSFAIASRYSTNDVDLVSNNFKKDKFRFYAYPVPLGDYFSSQLFREKTLHLHIENLFAYLLSELDYLVAPSVLCLLALLFCLGFLTHILQKEQKLNAVKNDFINNLAHELKTPAFSISLANKMAMENLKTGQYDKVAGFLKIMENENEKLKTHAEKVLELASLEHPSHSLQKEKTDLHVLVREVAAVFSEKIMAANGTLETQFNADHFVLEADKAHLKNALENILDNALKYGGQNLVVRMETWTENKSIVLKISDNGPGIPVPDQKHIFDKFYRVPSQGANAAKGFGLGLSYVKQVVTAHGGKVWVESKPGEGAAFYVSLALQFKSK